MADELPPLNDPSIAILSDALPGLAQDFSALREAVSAGKFETEKMNAETARVVDNLVNYGRVNRDAQFAVMEVIGAINKLKKEVSDTQEKQKEANKKHADSIAHVTGAMTAAGSTIGAVSSVLASQSSAEAFRGVTTSMTNLGGFVAKNAAEFGGLADVAKIAGAGLSTLSTVVIAVAQAMDAAATAQRGSVDSILQFGGATEDSIGNIRIMADAVAHATTKFNVGDKEASALAISFAKADMAIGKVTPGMDRVAASQLAMVKAVEITAAVHKATGADMASVGQIVTTLGTRFNLSGDDLQKATSVVISQWQKSGHSIDGFARGFTSLAKTTEGTAASFDQVSIGTRAYLDEVRKGTMTWSNVTSAMDAQSLGYEKMLGITGLINAQFPQLAEKLHFTGDTFADMFKLIKAQREEGFDLQKEVRSTMAKGMGTSPEMQAVAFQSLDPVFGKFSSDITTVANFMGQHVDKIKEAAVDQKAAAASSKESMTTLLSMGEAAAKAFDPPTTQFAGAVADFHTDVNILTTELKNKGFGGTMREIAQGALIEGGEALSAVGKAGIGPGPKYATGGFIPDDGQYSLHAGERVIRSGGGGGSVSVSVGGVNVTVGERGNLGGQLHEAMTQLESQIMKKIEDQWNQAALAQ